MADTFTYLAEKALMNVKDNKFLNTPYQLGEALAASFIEVGDVPPETLKEEVISLSKLPEKRDNKTSSLSLKTLLETRLKIEIVFTNLSEFLDECNISIECDFPVYPPNHKDLDQVAFVKADGCNIATESDRFGEYIKIFPTLNVATGFVSVLPLRRLFVMESIATVGLARTTNLI